MNGLAREEPVRRLRRAGVLVLLLATGGVAWCFGAPRSPSPVVPISALDLDGTLTGWAVATDRRGDHLAATTDDGRLHFVALSGDRLVDKALAASSELVGHDPVVLQFSDRNGDDLVELLAVAPRGATGYQAMRGRPPGVPVGPAAALLASQACERMQPVALRDADANWGTGLVPAEAVVGARSYVFLNATARRECCELAPADGRGRRQSLAGWPVAVGDLNGSGCDEILTAEHDRNEPSGATYRLFAADRHGFSQVWSHHVANAALFDVGFRPEVFLGSICDLDGDGVAELVIADWASGRVAAWRWADDALD